MKWLRVLVLLAATFLAARGLAALLWPIAGDLTAVVAFTVTVVILFGTAGLWRPWVRGGRHGSRVAQDHGDEWERRAYSEVLGSLLEADPAGVVMVHRDEVPWFEAEKPPRGHRCRAATVGYSRGVGFVYRCACGAIRGAGFDNVWVDRNSRS